MSTSSKIQFTYSDLDKVYDALLSNNKELHAYFDKYLEDAYKSNKSLMLHYFDIAEIGKFLIAKLKNEETEMFTLFFQKVEEILKEGDTDVQNLIVIGLFEGIQNVCGREINYYSGFNKWLMPESKLRWDNLIDFWEGTEWRNSNNSNT